MLKLAVNASEALFPLIDRGYVSVDFIKVPLSNYPGNRDSIEEALSRSPLILHPTQRGVLDLANWSLDQAVGTDALSDLLDLTRTVSLSTHIATKPGYLPTNAGCWTSTQLRQELRTNILRNIYHLTDKVLERYGDIPLLLENHPAAAWEDSIAVTTEPEFLNEITEAAGCEILLDIAHARVSAWFAGVSIFTYLNRYDLPRIKELHIAGPRIYEGQGMVDSHEALTDEDYKILLWVLERTSPRIITLEYGGISDIKTLPDGTKIHTPRNNPELLAWQITELKKIIG